MSRKYSIDSCCESAGYRYRLDVHTSRAGGPHLLVIQLNPSTANSAKSDATIGKVSNWAYEKGFAKVTFVNLFAKRTPHPDQLIGPPYGALNGPHNDGMIRAAVTEADVIVLAWGKIPRALERHFCRRHDFLRTLLRGRPVRAVGQPLRDGSPRHGRTWNESNRNLRRHRWRTLEIKFEVQH